MTRYEQQRRFLKSNFDEFKHIKTDKIKGLAQPPIVKPAHSKSLIIDLPKVSKDVVCNENIFDCINQRRSTRFYSAETLSLDELSYLLWATQGITGINKNGLTLRTVPCSGATHTFETYLIIMRVEGIQQGIYRYLPVEHKLLFMFELDELEQKIDAITLDQPFVPNFAKRLLSCLHGVQHHIAPNGSMIFQLTKKSSLMLDMYAKTFIYPVNLSVQVLAQLEFMIKS